MGAQAKPTRARTDLACAQSAEQAARFSWTEASVRTALAQQTATLCDRIATAAEPDNGAHEARMATEHLASLTAERRTELGVGW